MKWNIRRFLKRNSETKPVDTNKIDTSKVDTKNRQRRFKSTLTQLSKQLGDRELDRLLNNSFRKKEVFLVLESPHARLTELSGHSVTRLNTPSSTPEMAFSVSGDMQPAWYLDGSTLLMGMHFKDEVYANPLSYEDCISPLVKVLKKREHGRRFSGAIIYLHQDDLSSDTPPAWLNKMASFISLAASKSQESIPVYILLEGGDFSFQVTKQSAHNSDSTSMISTPIGMLRDKRVTTEQFGQWYLQVRETVSKRLLSKALKDVQYVHDVETRRAVFSELNTVEENLQQVRYLSEQLNQRWNFSDKSRVPWVRGVFVTPHFGKPLSAGGASLWWQRFGNLLIKDRYCNMADKPERSYKQWSVAGVITFLGLISLFCSQLILRDYAYASQLSDDFTGQLISLNADKTSENINDNGLSFDSVLKEFKGIERINRHLTREISKYSQWSSSLTQTVVDRGGIVLDELSEQVLHEQFGTQLNQEILHALKHNDDFETIYPALKSYLLLHQTREEGDEHLMWWFGLQWQNQYKNNPESRRQLAQYLSSFLKHHKTREQVEKKYEYDEQVVSLAREKMLSTPLAKRLYLGIKQKANSKQKRRDELKEIIGYRQADVFGESKIAVNTFYTANAYKTIFLPYLRQSLEQASADEWVLGIESESEGEQETTKSESLKQEIYSLYMADYIYAWDDFLKKLSISKTNSFEHLGGLLDASTGNEGAIRRVLQYVYGNTAEYSVLNRIDARPMLNRVAKSAAEKAAVNYLSTQNTPSIHPMKAVSVHFERLNSVLKNSENKSSAMDEIDTQLQQLDEYLIEFENTESSVVFEATIKRVAGGKRDPISHLKRTSKMMPEQVKNWVNSFASQAWAHMIGHTRQHINSAYKNELYASYLSNIKARYPLNRKSTNDIGLEHFSDYFKPEGEEQRFFKEYLKPFVRTGNKRWNERKTDGLRLGLTRSYLSQLHRAQTIRDVMFKNQEIYAELQFQPIYLDANVSRFDLDLMGERLNYRHGPQKISKVSWPASLNNTDISMRFEDYNGNLTTEALTGEWSLFKLIDLYGKETMPGGRRYRMSFEVNGQRAVYDVSGRSLSPDLLSILSKYKMPLKPLG
mgnify:CR=1 FL=1